MLFAPDGILGILLMCNLDEVLSAMDKFYFLSGIKDIKLNNDIRVSWI